MNYKRLLRVLTCAFAVTLSTIAFGQTGKPLKIVAGTAAGGAMDSLARQIAEKIQSTLNRTVVVEAKAGGNGRIAAETVKAAPPDGNTILVTASAAMVLLPQIYADIKYDPFKDFRPVSLLGSYQIVFAVPADGPRTLKEFINNAKKQPLVAMYGSPAAGNLMHFMGFKLSQVSDVPLTLVPFQGAAPLVTALLGNQVPSALLGTGDALRHYQSGRLRILAVSGSKRSQLLPDVPTFKELGYDVEGVAWFAAYAPANTPQPLVDSISDAIATALKRADVQEKLQAMGIEPGSGSSRELAEIHRSDYAKYGPTIKASGFKGEN